MKIRRKYNFLWVRSGQIKGEQRKRIEEGKIAEAKRYFQLASLIQ